MLDSEKIRKEIIKYGERNGVIGITNSVHMLADESKIHFTNLYRMLKKKSASLETVVALCNALKLQPNDIILLG